MHQGGWFGIFFDGAAEEPGPPAVLSLSAATEEELAGAGEEALAEATE